ncbi:MAG: hypothetical protein ACRCXZ_08345, partial [Patescibacteria group bacterium]
MNPNRNFAIDIVKSMSNPIVVKKSSEAFCGIVVDEKGNPIESIDEMKIGTSYFFVAYNSLEIDNYVPDFEKDPLFSAKIEQVEFIKSKIATVSSNPFDMFFNGLNSEENIITMVRTIWNLSS